MTDENQCGTNVRLNEELGVLARGYFHDMPDGDYELFDQSAGPSCDDCKPCVVLSAEEYERLREAVAAAYDNGWRTAANWMDRDDLHADIGSPAYEADKAKALTPNGGIEPPPAGK